MDPDEINLDNDHLDLLKDEDPFGKPNKSVDDSVAIDKPGERTSLLDVADGDSVKEIVISPDGRLVNENEVKK